MMNGRMPSVARFNRLHLPDLSRMFAQFIICRIPPFHLGHHLQRLLR